MTEEKILDRVRKLLALSGSSNEHEAALAASRAQALLAEHNLSMSDIRTDEVNIDKGDTIDAESHPWPRWVAVHVGNLYFCKAMLYRGNKLYRSDRHFFIGEKHNVQVAEAMFTYLVDTIKRLSSQGSAHLPIKGGHRRKFAHAFKTGCAARVCDRLQKKLEAAKRGELERYDGNGFLPVLATQYDQADLANEKAVNDMFDKVKKRDSNARIGSTEGFVAGRRAGDSVTIDQQIEGQ